MSTPMVQTFDDPFKLYLLKIYFLYISKGPTLLYNAIMIFETPHLYDDLFRAILP